MKTVCPAVLVEHGFYTNREELVKLKEDAFREKCSDADAKGILQYLGISWNEEETKMEKKETHWAEKYLDNLEEKGTIDTP
ncbi:N-acetylmuramoyl-L-alanine amidase [Aminipila terrae]|uniref:N-acetylmuramoyl-L-alanine amidase n=1 Tax=Aminipila terrae TaxID=2697030 RepID=UPI001FAE2B34|nr:N-acetylmuramoyl-L-alanine amidase [Aminipila terrae]